MRTLALALVLTVSACGNDDANAARLTQLKLELAEVAISSGGDCAQVAAALQTVLHKHSAELKELKSWSDELQKDPEKTEKVWTPYLDRYFHAARITTPIRETCNDNPDFRAFLRAEAKLF
jgi:hypothetical protein